MGSKAKQKRIHPVYCAWCQAEGIKTIVGWSTIEGSHGVCKYHFKQVLREADHVQAKSCHARIPHPVPGPA